MAWWVAVECLFPVCSIIILLNLLLLGIWSYETDSKIWSDLPWNFSTADPYNKPPTYMEVRKSKRRGKSRKRDEVSWLRHQWRGEAATQVEARMWDQGLESAGLFMMLWGLWFVLGQQSLTKGNNLVPHMKFVETKNCMNMAQNQWWKSRRPTLARQHWRGSKARGRHY